MIRNNIEQYHQKCNTRSYVGSHFGATCDPSGTKGHPSVVLELTHLVEASGGGVAKFLYLGLDGEASVVWYTEACCQRGDTLVCVEQVFEFGV